MAKVFNATQSTPMQQRILHLFGIKQNRGYFGSTGRMTNGEMVAEFQLCRGQFD